MTNHYHIVVETIEGNLSPGMRQLNGVYTQMINRSHNRVGHEARPWGSYRSMTGAEVAPPVLRRLAARAIISCPRGSVSAAGGSA